jgi:hypothetical protein
MFIIGGLLKMSQIVNSFLLFLFKFETISIIQKSEGEIDLNLKLTFICFQKVGLLNSRVRVGAGAASKNFLEPEPHKNYAAPQHCL